MDKLKRRQVLKWQKEKNSRKLSFLYLLKDPDGGDRRVTRSDPAGTLRSAGFPRCKMLTAKLYIQISKKPAPSASTSCPKRHGNDWFYYIGSREFELAELKLLVDTVQSAKFITERKSQALINKLESLVSRHEAGQLHRQVLISGRIKTMNESVYYNVDRSCCH